MGKVIAIDLGGTSCKLAVINKSGEILDQWSVPTDISNEGSKIVPNIIASIKEYLEDNSLSTADFLGIGMGSPGKVSISEKTVIGAYNLNWKTEQKIGLAFEEAFALPFYIENDANIAALGEQAFGAGDGDDEVVFITLGTGVGGGIISSGKLIHGAGGAAGEVGHITVEPVGGFSCTCGKSGCLETVASATGVVNLAKRQAKTTEFDTDISRKVKNGEDVSSKDIFDAAKEGCLFSESVVDEFAMYLGLACGHLGNILNPSKIILGGGVSQAGKYLLDAVVKHYNNYIFQQIRESTEIVLATLGNDAGILGACQLVLSN